MCVGGDGSSGWLPATCRQLWKLCCLPLLFFLRMKSRLPNNRAGSRTLQVTRHLELLGQPGKVTVPTMSGRGLRLRGSELLCRASGTFLLRTLAAISCTSRRQPPSHYPGCSLAPAHQQPPPPWETCSLCTGPRQAGWASPTLLILFRTVKEPRALILPWPPWEQSP